jgi:membrane-bound metal-dependent hydrolase YbcI (DUF457 family)
LDIGTHALATVAIMRGFFPRHGWGVAIGMLLAGTLADVDASSALFGPATYLSWRGTYTHSLLGTMIVVAFATLVALRLNKQKELKLTGIVLAMAVAALAHLLLDWYGSDGVMILWPVSGRRFAADLLPSVDAWILIFLILGIVLPELFRLVGSEIGTKEKGPRGRNGAIVALLLILIYAGVRFVLHANALVELDAHAYKGESPRRVGAFADALSLFTWHGIVETQTLLCQLEAEVGPGHVFDADAATCQHKPESSAALAAAQNTEAAEKFLRVARFPKATVERTQDGYEVVICALEDEAMQTAWRRVAARVTLNEQARVINEELVWTASSARH